MLHFVIAVCLSFAPVSHGHGCNRPMDNIRLVGGENQGLVEICQSNQWESVCNFLWTDLKAEIVCRELNLPHIGAQAVNGGGCSTFNMFNTTDSGIIINHCNGAEESITDCEFSVTGNCMAAGVICNSPCEPSFCNDTTFCSLPTSSCYCPSDSNCTCYDTVCDPPCLNGGSCAAPGECVCPPGWSGDTCQQAICDPPCSNGGNCTAPNTCQCPVTWGGDQCQIAICDPPCSNGGNCTGPNTCQCPAKWRGDHCQQVMCEEGFCLNGGTCLHPDTNCTCPVDWTGDRCNKSQHLSTESHNMITIITSSTAGACLLVLTILALMALCVAIQLSRRRKRTIQADTCTSPNSTETNRTTNSITMITEKASHENCAMEYKENVSYGIVSREENVAAYKNISYVTLPHRDADSSL